MQEIVGYYQHLKKFSPLHTHFAFLDTEDYLADRLFIKNQVRVYFGDEYVTPGSPYRIIFCHVRKQDEKRFHAAMRELPNKMLLCGNVDYLDACSHIWGKLLNAETERRDSRGADDPAEQAQ